MITASSAIAGTFQRGTIKNVAGNIGDIETLIGVTPVKAVIEIGDFVFFSRTGSDNLYVFDKDTGQVESGYTINATQEAEQFATDGKRLWLLEVGQAYIRRIVVDGGSGFPTTPGTLNSAQTCIIIASCGDYLYIGMSTTNNLYRYNTSVESLDLGRVTTLFTYNAGYLYSSTVDAATIQVEVSSFTIIKTIADAGVYTTTSFAFSDGIYTVRSGISNYSAGLQRTKISDDTTTTINTYATIYEGIVPFRFDGYYLWFYQTNGISYDIYRMILSEFTLTYVTTIPLIPIIGLLDFSGGELYIGSSGNILKYKLIAPSYISNMLVAAKPDPAIIKGTYIDAAFDEVRIRYYTPPNSSSGAVRGYYILKFDPEIGINSVLKKFSGNRKWLIHRTDAEVFLKASGTEKHIINLSLFDHDGTTPFEFIDLPSDENFYILAENGDDAQIFLWYNEELYKTYYSDPDPAVEYEITACFQIMKKDVTEYDLVNHDLNKDGPMDGALQLNNEDNEKLRV
jgi:hypothetical protein